MSSLLRHLKHGIDLEWRGPFGEFTYVRNKVPAKIFHH